MTPGPMCFPFPSPPALWNPVHTDCLDFATAVPTVCWSVNHTSHNGYVVCVTQASATIQMRSAIFWDITQHRVVMWDRLMVPSSWSS